LKQILQSLKTGATEVADIPCPVVQSGQLLIRTSRTLVSAGTERMLVNFGKAGWLDKARQQPDKVGMVIDKMKTDGVLQTVESVRNKLDQPLALGYCNVGAVLETGRGVNGFSSGERVVSNGKHAEVVSVPVNLAAKVPDSVSDDEAAFTVVAAIGLQGIRLVNPTLGESVVVTGLGLIGLLTVQLLRANGCRVLGIDFDPRKLELAKHFGAEVVNLSAGEDPLAAANVFTRGRGADAVLITASTDSNEPVAQAAKMCRKRGRIVLVGVTGLELSRADFYEKELSFQVSCSYGPGRYDTSYEEKGVDYPVGLVRWTEQRNFEAVLDMMASGRLNVAPLITHRFAIDDAAEAYDVISGTEPSLGVLIEYPSTGAKSDDALRRATVSVSSGAPPIAGKPAVAFIGSGNYATAVLIPAFAKAGASLKTVVSSSGVSGAHAARKFGFESTTTDSESVFSDPAVDAVVIATRHNTHASLVQRALTAGKHAFVEKPIAITLDELSALQSARDAASAAGRRKVITAGFNRRFSPHVAQMKKLLGSTKEPRAFVMTVNAGAIPPGHWAHDPAIGAGRIIGEGCHFIDLLRYLAGSRIASATGVSLGADSASINLGFEDGSIGTVHYLTNGNKSYPKERLEVFVGGRILELDNFRKLRAYGWPGFSKMNLMWQDKGQRACAAAFVKAVSEGGPDPIPFDELMEVGRVTIEIAEALRTGA
jgi:predicted dehydrogenase/threonine dehydrogenase-like Zn-dependent dehydrogenase